MTAAVETYISDGSTIFKLNNKYSSGTVRGEYYQDGVAVPLTVTELGEDYLEISEVPQGLTIKINYTIFGAIANTQEEFEIKERLARLEKGMEDMYEIIKAQKEAINNRVNITSFKAWTSLIEKKMGIKLVDGNLNYITKELNK